MGKSPTLDELVASAIETIEKRGRFAAVELLNRHDPDLVAEVYRKLQSELYWKRKNVPLTVAISQAGIQHGLTAAGRVEDVGVGRSLRVKAKALAFNLASFTWPGWDEEGIALDQSCVAAGMDAARLNLQLAEELDRPEDAKSNAWWALGAHRMAVPDFNGAEEAFVRAADHAAKAQMAVLQKAMETYALMSKVLFEPELTDARTKFDLALATLQRGNGEGAAFFAEQIKVASRIFQSAASART